MITNVEAILRSPQLRQLHADRQAALEAVAPLMARVRQAQIDVLRTYGKAEPKLLDALRTLAR